MNEPEVDVVRFKFRILYKCCIITKEVERIKDGEGDSYLLFEKR